MNDTCDINSQKLYSRVNTDTDCFSIMRRSTRNFNTPPSPGQSPGIWTFEDWIVQIPAPSGQNSVQMPHPIVEFVCQMPLSAPVVFNEACA